jgi:hypothetical protein
MSSARYFCHVFIKLQISPRFLKTTDVLGVSVEQWNEEVAAGKDTPANTASQII